MLRLRLPTAPLAILAIVARHRRPDPSSTRRRRRMHRQRSGRRRVRPADGRARPSCCSRSRTATSRCTSRRCFTGLRSRSIALAGIRKVTAANLRLPSALYAIAGALLTMLFAYEFSVSTSRVLAGLALAASYQYISQGRFGRVDMTLCFFETLSLFAFLRWLPRDADFVRPRRALRIQPARALLCSRPRSVSACSPRARSARFFPALRS